jgi:hypothetical protein
LDELFVVPSKSVVDSSLVLDEIDDFLEYLSSEALILVIRADPIDNLYNIPSWKYDIKKLIK